MKFVFVFLPDQGHLQICLAIGKYLIYKDPTNEVTFLTDESNKKKIKGKRKFLVFII